MTKAEEYHKALQDIYDPVFDSGPARAAWLSPAVVELITLAHGIVNWCAHLESQIAELQERVEMADWRERR